MRQEADLTSGFISEQFVLIQQALQRVSAWRRPRGDEEPQVISNRFWQTQTDAEFPTAAKGCQVFGDPLVHTLKAIDVMAHVQHGPIANALVDRTAKLE